MDPNNGSRRRRPLERCFPENSPPTQSKIRRTLVESQGSNLPSSYEPHQTSNQCASLKTKPQIPKSSKARLIPRRFLQMGRASVTGKNRSPRTITQRIHELPATANRFPLRGTQQYDKSMDFQVPPTSWQTSWIKSLYRDSIEKNSLSTSSVSSADGGVQRNTSPYNNTALQDPLTPQQRLRSLTEFEMLKKDIMPRRTAQRSFETPDSQCRSLYGNINFRGKQGISGINQESVRNLSKFCVPRFCFSRFISFNGSERKDREVDTQNYHSHKELPTFPINSFVRRNMRPRSSEVFGVPCTRRPLSTYSAVTGGRDYSPTRTGIGHPIEQESYIKPRKHEADTDLFSRLIKKFRLEDKIKREQAEAAKIHPFSDEPISQHASWPSTPSPVTGVLITATDDPPWNKKKRLRCAGSPMPPLTYKYETSILATEHLVHKYFPSTSTPPQDNPPLDAHVHFDTPVKKGNETQMGDVIKNVYRNARKLRQVQRIERLLKREEMTSKKKALLTKTYAKYSDMGVPLLTPNDEVRCVYRNIVKGYN